MSQPTTPEVPTSLSVCWLLSEHAESSCHAWPGASGEAVVGAHKVVDHVLALVDHEARLGRHARVAQLMAAWLAVCRRAAAFGDNNSDNNKGVHKEGEDWRGHVGGGLRAVSEAFFRCYPLQAREAILQAVRQAIQSHDHPLAHRLLDTFMPLALVALHIRPSPTTGDNLDPTAVQQYYSEVVKLVLLAFTSLATASRDEVEVLSFQSQHLALALPALIHFFTDTLNALDATSASLLRTLVSQALLSVARNAPQPFKEQVRWTARGGAGDPRGVDWLTLSLDYACLVCRAQVQALSPDARVKLEATLRASMTASGSSTGSSSGGNAKANSGLKIDMSQYSS